VVDVSFVFTNPRHHVEMMVPVARELGRRGIRCQLISLAELRGFRTPPVTGVPVRRVIPFNIRGKPKVGVGSRRAGVASGVTRTRELARRAVSMALVPAIRLMLSGSRAIVIPNDSVFPYTDLIESLRGRVPYVLMQEGIRFDSPDGDRYGTNGAAALCVWGEGSAEFFAGRGAPASAIVVTGAPRLDALDPSTWSTPGRDLLAALHLDHRPIAFLSNPIENQGFGSLDDKLAMFDNFLREVEPVVRERDLAVIVKNHLHEEPADFARVAAATPLADRVHVPQECSVFAALAVSSAAVVLTSTIGLEAMMFDVPVGAMEIPGFGFAFEYVSHGGALGLRRGAIADGVRALLDDDPARRDRSRAFIARHLHDRGRATGHVADAITRVLS
jgi:hypothetical protein